MEIQKMMERAGLSVTQLADRLDVSYQTVYDWCHGNRRPACDKLPIIADLLHCSIDELFGRR